MLSWLCCRDPLPEARAAGDGDKTVPAPGWPGAMSAVGNRSDLYRPSTGVEESFPGVLAFKFTPPSYQELFPRPRSDSTGSGSDVSIRSAPLPEPDYQPLKNNAIGRFSSFRADVHRPPRDKHRPHPNGGPGLAAKDNPADYRALLKDLQRNCTPRRVDELLGGQGCPSAIARFNPQEQLCIILHIMQRVITVPDNNWSMAALFDRARDMLSQLPAAWAISRDDFLRYAIPASLCLPAAVAGRQAIQPAGEAWWAISNRLLQVLPAGGLYEKFVDILIAIQPLWSEYQAQIMVKIINLSGRMPKDQKGDKHRLINSIMARSDSFLDRSRFIVLKALVESRDPVAGINRLSLDDPLYQRALGLQDINEKNCIMQIISNLQGV